MPTKRTSRRKKVAPKSRGLSATQLAGPAAPSETMALADAVAGDGGTVLATYRDPLGGQWQVLAALPIDAVHPTSFQRDLSDAHVKRLAVAIDKLDRFLDPIITVRSEDGRYWTPNGHHRCAAMRALGARSIVSIVVPDEEIAFRILALNTEKAHNLKERSLEVIRMAQSLAELDSRPERSFEVQFEDPTLLTLGICYQERARFGGSVYHSVLKRIDRFLTTPLPQALATREIRSGKVLELDDAVSAAVDALKARGFDSPYLKAFVVARINPLRFKRGATGDFNPTIQKMLSAAERFDANSIRRDQIGRSGGPVDD